jgi:hypothetical protein
MKTLFLEIAAFERHFAKELPRKMIQMRGTHVFRQFPPCGLAVVSIHNQRVRCMSRELSTQPFT